jgi:hypothetical protein
LAQNAQGWANKCKYAHGQPANVDHPDTIGQSIFSGLIEEGNPFTGKVLARIASDAWFAEKLDYNYAKAACEGSECRHYTQVRYRYNILQL